MPRFKTRRTALRRYLMADRISTFSLLTLTAIAVATALSFLRTPLIPFVLAVFLTYIVAPMVDWFQKVFRLPRWAALGLTFTLTLGGLILLGMFVVGNFQSLLASADVYRVRLLTLAADTALYLQRFNIPINPETLMSSIRDYPVFPTITIAAGELVNIITSGVLMVIFLFFLVMGSNPADKRHGIYAEIDGQIQKYISMKLATSAATAILCGIAWALMGVELAFMFGLMTFFLNFIPTIGSIVAVLLPLPIVLLQFDSPVKWLIITAVPVVIQGIIGNFIEPKIFSDSLDLHPASILLALTFWGIIWGPIGMFLAVPIVVVLKIAMARIPATRPFAELMAGRLPILGTKE